MSSFSTHPSHLLEQLSHLSRMYLWAFMITVAMRKTNSMRQYLSASMIVSLLTLRWFYWKQSFSTCSKPMFIFFSEFWNSWCAQFLKVLLLFFGVVTFQSFHFSCDYPSLWRTCLQDGHFYFAFNPPSKIILINTNYKWESPWRRIWRLVLHY